MLTKKSDNDYIHFFNNDLWSVKGELNLKEITHSYDESEEIQDFFIMTTHHSNNFIHGHSKLLYVLLNQWRSQQSSSKKSGAI